LEPCRAECARNVLKQDGHGVPFKFGAARLCDNVPAGA
jgi:hypothetical protein